MRGRFDVTGKLVAGHPNALAVRIEKNATPGSVHQKTLERAGKNGGGLAPTTPRFMLRLAGIGFHHPRTQYRYLGRCLPHSDRGGHDRRPVCLRNLASADTSSADLSIEVDLQNHQSTPVTGTLRGRFGDLRFEQRVKLAGLRGRQLA